MGRAAPPGRQDGLARPAHGSRRPPYVLVELLSQFLDVTQNSLGWLPSARIRTTSWATSWVRSRVRRAGLQAGWGGGLLPAGVGHSHQTGPPGGRGPRVLTQSLVPAMPPAPSYQEIILHQPADPGKLPGMHEEVSPGTPLPTRTLPGTHLMEADDGPGGCGPCADTQRALQELSKEPQEDGAQLLSWGTCAAECPPHPPCSSPTPSPWYSSSRTQQLGPKAAVTPTCISGRKWTP